MIPSGRVATVAAVSFLLCDALLLLYAGFESRRTSLSVAGAGCLLLAAAVFWAWRRHRRNLDELAAARHDMRAQVEEMRELIRRRPT